MASMASVHDASYVSASCPASDSPSSAAMSRDDSTASSSFSLSSMGTSGCYSPTPDRTSEEDDGSSSSFGGLSPIISPSPNNHRHHPHPRHHHGRIDSASGSPQERVPNPWFASANAARDRGRSDSLAYFRQQRSSSISSVLVPSLLAHNHGSSASSTSSKHSSRNPSPTRRRTKQQRRRLNRIALFLPRRLRFLAASYTRIFVALTAALSFLFLFCALVAPAIRSPRHSYYEYTDEKDVPGRVGENGPANGMKRDQLPLPLPVNEQGEPDLLSKLQMPDELPADTPNEESTDVAAAVEEGAIVETREVQIGGDEEVEKASEEPEAEKEEVKEECKTCGKRGCDPEGYPKGREMLLNNAPMRRYKDNLRPDQKYLTFGMMNGFSSQFVALANGLYLSKLSDRVPLLPPFAGSAHLDRTLAGYLPFSAVFDVASLETLLRHPVQEWGNVKISAEQTPPLPALARGAELAPRSLEEEAEARERERKRKAKAKALAEVEREKVGCWSLWAAQMPEPGRPAGSSVQNHLGLDVEYWQAPLHFSHPPLDRHIRYWDLVLLDHNIDLVKTRQLSSVAKAKREEYAESHGGKAPTNAQMPLPPDEQLLCFDTLYYTAATGPTEWWQPHAPVWKTVGRYARWNKDVDALVDRYLNKLLVEQDGRASLPEFISVHVKTLCTGSSASDTAKCLPSLEPYKVAVKRQRERHLDATGDYLRTVVATTDSTDPAFLQRMETELGWTVVDHGKLGTVEETGNIWWSVVVDAVVQSRGRTFVGTEKSVMSLLAGKRVEDWNKGSWELVKAAL